MSMRKIGAVMVLGLAAVPAGCREDVAGPGSERVTESVEEGSVQFLSSVEDIAFRASGAPLFTDEGKVGFGEWAVAGRNERDPNRKLTVIAFQGTSRDNSVLLAFQIPQGQYGRRLDIDTECDETGCSSMTIFFGVDPSNPRNEDVTRSCEATVGEVLIYPLNLVERTGDQVLGEFNARGLCRDNPDSPPVQFDIINGIFDVDIVEQYHTNIDP